MKNRKLFLVALLAILPAGIGPAEGAKTASKKSASAKAPEPIALIADRRVEEADIRRAASVMFADPLRKTKPAAWRKKLLDLCVDRELLALEAERAGFLNNPLVKRRVQRESASVLYSAIREHALLREIEPTAAHLDTARAGGLFRRVKLTYILGVMDLKTTKELSTALRKGASFDSIATLYSIHPTAPRGGHVGWKQVRQLNMAAWRDVKASKPGDLLGPYSNSDAHEFFKIEDVAEPTDKELREMLLFDRGLELQSRYNVGLLRKYKFEMNPEMVSPMIFAAATEKGDSILASLDERGMRAKQGVRPSLGVLARVEGDSVTFRDIAYPDLLPREADGKAHIEDTRHLVTLCMTAVLPRLIERDARERGIDRDPAVARSLRLVREEVSTRAMVARAVPAPDDAAIRGHFTSKASRYVRPAARRALVAMFTTEDSARASLGAWGQAGFGASSLASYGLREQPRATAMSLLSGFYAELPLYETDQDPLSKAAWALGEGQLSPVVQTAHGYAIARVLGREPSRPMSFEEASSRLQTDVREDLENAWVVSLLERLRAATPARTMPDRLESVRLGMTETDESGGKRR